MGNKLKLRNRKQIIKKRLLLTILFVTFFTWFTLWFFNKKLVPLLVNYATIEIERIVNLVINNASTNEAISLLEQDQLITIVQNDNNDIQAVYFNSILVNKFLNVITDSIQNDLIKVSGGDMSSVNGYESHNNGVVFYVPLGVLTGNLLLSEVGPKIPIRLQLLGYINSNIETNIKEYGINNVLMEMYIQIDTKSRVVLPFASKDIVVVNKIPVSYKLIQGNIPEYYQNGISANSNLFSLPLK